MFRLLRALLRPVLLPAAWLLDLRLRGRRGRFALCVRLEGHWAEEPSRAAQPPWASLLRQLQVAGDDPSVEALLFEIGHLQIGWARLAELRAAIEGLRRSGKRCFALLERAGHEALFVASACERITVIPSTSVDLVGLRAEVTFYKKALDHLGVVAHFEAAGDYKSLGEPYTRESMSDAFRESLDGVLGAIHEALRDALARGRGLDPDRVQALIDGGPWTPEQAKAHGLVDAVDHPDRWRRATREALAAPGPRADVPLRSLDDHLRPWRLRDRLSAWTRRRPLIAVVGAAGAIGDDDQPTSQPGHVAWRALGGAIDDLRKDPGVAAVVLRVDSPGGSARASDLLWRALQRLGKKKPLVASMGDVAASGGYYLAMAADHVVAAPLTITGSIGVVAGKVDVSGLLDKIGLRQDVLSYGAHSGLFSMVGGFEDGARERLRDLIEAGYRDFVTKASGCRKMPYDRLEQHARGRIWTGSQARLRGLVDAEGGLFDAIAEAARRAGVSDYQIVLVGAPRPGWAEQLRRLGGGSFGFDLRTTRRALDALREPLLQARMPFELDVR